MDSPAPVLGIIVGGGPAPGINGVISAATIEARNNGWDVVGFYDGFKHLMAGDTNNFTPLRIRDVSRIHFSGGSILRTSRANPTKKPEHLQNVVKSLEHFNVRHLMTIGGDDTAFSSSRVREAAEGRIAVAHVPKTIDNDLPLPPSIPTFGYQTARQVGTEIVSNLMADAHTASRWYVVVAMGRKAGHLALGIGKAASCPLTIVPEEFGSRPVTFREICDIIEGAILKRRSLGSDHGVAILAEGLVESMSPEHIEEVFGNDDIPRDEHGHIVLADIELGQTVRNELRRRFKERGVSLTVVSKNLGYELRCADPNPFDAEYTRDLGYGAVRFLIEGGSGAVITFQGHSMKPLPFGELADPATGRPRLRMVDINGERYQVARKYMIRLESRDASEPSRLKAIADKAKMTPDQFLERFGYLMGN